MNKTPNQFMGRSFMIQPFDNGPFAKRYDDVFAPAIREAGLGRVPILV
jgi:hypothetical protein